MWYDAPMTDKQKALSYMRGPETIGQRLPYEEKFGAFVQAIAEAKSKGVDILVIAAPWVIGDTYGEVIESLSRLADSGITLHVVQR